MTLGELIAHHSPKIALQFSGGRDSLALLLLLQPYWDQLTVYHTNPGDEYPETREIIEAVKSVVPNFVEIQGRVHEVHERFGWPSDVLPAGAGFKHVEPKPLRLVDRYTCCYLSHMEPTHHRMVADGITLILRGQRSEDAVQSPVQSGMTVDGFTIVYPINDWSTEQVENFIKAADVPLPPYYAAGLTSAPDCMHCTAWLEHGANKYLQTHHPVVHAEVNRRLKAIKISVEPHIANLAAAIEN